MYSFGNKFDTFDDRMFKSRGFRAHAVKVSDQLDACVQFLQTGSLDALKEMLQQLGAKHVSHGIMPEYYPRIGKCLMKALSTILGEEGFSREVEEAWSAMYGFITQSMLEGANESLLRVSFPLYSHRNGGKSITLDEYICSMLPEQKQLYYITAKASVESMNLGKIDKMQLAKDLQQEGVSVLHISRNKRDLYADNLARYLGYKLVDVEGDFVDLSFLPHIQEKHKKAVGAKKPRAARREAKQKGRQSRENEDSAPVPVPNKVSPHASPTPENDDNSKDAESPRKVAEVSSNGELSASQADSFCVWFQATIGPERILKCTPTCRFASQPGKVQDLKTAEGTRQLEDYSVSSMTGSNLNEKGPHYIEINPAHKLIRETNQCREREPSIARILAEQIYDSCLITAGINLQCPRSSLTRMNDLICVLLREHNNK